MKTKLLLAVCAALALAGCQTSVNTVEPTYPIAPQQVIPNTQVITDPNLDRGVHVLASHSALGTGGFLKVQLEVENLTHSRQSFTYKVKWLDQNGMAIELPTSTPIPMTLEGRERSSITFISPTPLSRDFRVQFLPAQN
jgi:uncharacterized protein YcfL